MYIYESNCHIYICIYIHMRTGLHRLCPVLCNVLAHCWAGDAFPSISIDGFNGTSIKILTSCSHNHINMCHHGPKRDKI